MVELGQAELSLNGVVVVTRSQPLSRLGILAVQIATLYHEVLDNPVEEQRIIDMLLDELQEVVTMLRRLVEQRNTDVASRRLQQHPLRRSLCQHLTRHHRHRNTSYYLFHCHYIL